MIRQFQFKLVQAELCRCSLGVLAKLWLYKNRFDVKTDVLKERAEKKTPWISITVSDIAITNSNSMRFLYTFG